MKNIGAKKQHNPVAVGLLLIGVSAAGRALLGVPTVVSTAELMLTMVSAVGAILLGTECRSATVPALGQIVPEILLVGLPATGAWVWPRTLLRAADLGLLVWFVHLVLCFCRDRIREDRYAFGAKWMVRCLIAAYLCQAVVMLCYAADPAHETLHFMDTAVFMVFSLLLLWYTVLVIRGYRHALKTQE